MAINDPRDIPGLVAWYSAEAETSYVDGAQVTQWTDLSGLGNHAVAAGTTKPLWKAAAGSNGGPAVRFQGSGYFTLPNVMSGATEGEVFARLKFTGGDSNSSLWAFGSATGVYAAHSYTYAGSVYEGFGRQTGGGDTRAIFTPTVAVNAWRTYNVWSAAGDWSARLDGTTQSTGAAAGGVAFTSTPALGVTVENGALRLSQQWVGDMSAVILFSRKLTATERTDLEAWLAANPSGGWTSRTYTDAVRSDAPWGFWEQNETSGTTLADSSGNSRPLTISGTDHTLNIAGPDSMRAVGWAAGSGLARTNVALASFPTVGTMELWVYLDALPNQNTTVMTPAPAAGSTGAPYILRIRTDGKPEVQGWNGGTVLATASTALTLGEWHHIAASIGPAGTKIRVNKATVATHAATGMSNLGTTNYVYIRKDGQWSGAAATNGAVKIAAPAFYTTQLSDARTDAHYDAALATAPSLSATLSAVLPALTASFTVTLRPTGTVTTNRANGIIFGGRGYVDSNPAVVLPPAHLQRGHDYVKALAYTAPTVTNGRVLITPDIEQIPRDRDRIIVGGKDVTYFRDVPTPQPAFLLTEPLAYGATTLVFPQTHAAFEQAGSGDLRWLDKERGVRFERVDPDTGEVVGVDYRGVITALRVESVSLDGASKLCWVADVGGSLSGRASLRDRQVPLFRWVRDIGRHVWASVRALNLRMTPRYGPTTGIELVVGGGMTQLDWINHLCAMAVQKDGTQYTLMPIEGDLRQWEFRPKDTTTRHATVYFDSGNIVPNLRDDIAEQPNTIYGTGVTPEGMKVKNGVYPGLKQGPTPDYPFTDGRTFGVGTTDAQTTGDRITAMNWKLEAAGYLPREAVNGTYSTDTAEAVEALQDDAGLTVTGTMDTATWDALYDLSATGYSLRFSHIAPMAQRHYVRRWWTTSTGARITRNGSHDPTRLEVHKTVNFGAGHSTPTMFRWARREISRTSGKNWVGTFKVSTGALIRGDHTPGTPLTAADVMPLRELRPGMNVWAPLFDGGTLLHVAGINIDEGGKTGTVTVDTKFRDMMTVAEIIDRNRESRHDPARAWMRQNRSSKEIKDSLITFDEVGGVIFDTIECPAEEWTLFPVVAGQEGTIRKIALQTEAAPAAYSLSVWGLNPGRHNLNNTIPAPLVMDEDGDTVWSQELDLFTERLLLASWGDEEQPCGYAPGKHTNIDGDTTSDPITGKFVDEAQFSYHTGNHPVLWVAIWPTVATTIKPQRIMWPQLEEGS